MKKSIQKNKKLFIWLGVVLILSLLPVLFLFTKGFFLSDDGEWMVIRFSAFYQTLRDGQFPPRFFGRLNHSYGYPIGNFLYPAFMYLATPFKILGFSFAESIKAVIILSFLSSGAGMFLWLRRMFSDKAAFIGSIVYVYYPYHLYDLYVRGSIGELLAFGVLPFLLLSINLRKTIIASFLFAVLILSHNTFALIVLPFLIFYTYLCAKRSLFLLFPFGLLLSAFFWLPSLVELPLTIFSQTPIAQWGEYFLTLKNSSLIGVLGVSLLGGAGIVLYGKKHTITLFFIVIYVLAIILSTPMASMIWSMGLLPKLVQFPWRFLLLAVWSGAFLSAFIVDNTHKIPQKVVMLVLMLLVGISAYPQVMEYKPVVRDDGYYATNEDTTTVLSEYMPKTVTVIPHEHPSEKVVVTQGQATISNLETTTLQTSFDTVVSGSAQLTVMSVFYPGWYAKINGKKEAVSVSKEGYVSLLLPAGTHSVMTGFEETPVRLAADIVSLLTMISLVTYVVLTTYRTRTGRVATIQKHDK